MAWGLVAGAAISVVGGAIAGAGQAKSAKAQTKAQQQEDELNFQRQDWLAQQQRAWQLQDRQFKQQAIGGFQNYWKTGGDVKPPTQSTAGLMNFDPNKLGSVPINNAPAPAAPLAQLTPPQQATLPRQVQ